MKTVALIDYGSGNLPSAEKALWAAARSLNKRRDIRATCDPDFVSRADYIVLPGVGAFRACMEALSQREGLTEALTEAVQRRAAPFLGVCVGMQLLADKGLEFGETAGLGWIHGEVRKLVSHEHHIKIPHMGWNNVRPELSHSLTSGLGGPGSEGKHMYFTHSFAFHPSDPAHMAASVDHGGRFAAMVLKDNVAGVQFHPEKSQAVGLGFIQSFLEWRP